MHYGHGWIMGEDGKRWHPAVHKMNCWQNYLRKNGGTNAIEGAAATVPLSPGERLNGLITLRS